MKYFWRFIGLSLGVVVAEDFIGLSDSRVAADPIFLIGSTLLVCWGLDRMEERR